MKNSTSLLDMGTLERLQLCITEMQAVSEARQYEPVRKLGAHFGGISNTDLTSKPRKNPSNGSFLIRSGRDGPVRVVGGKYMNFLRATKRSA